MVTLHGSLAVWKTNSLSFVTFFVMLADLNAAVPFIDEINWPSPFDEAVTAMTKSPPDRQNRSIPHKVSLGYWVGVWGAWGRFRVLC